MVLNILLKILSKIWDVKELRDASRNEKPACFKVKGAGFQASWNCLKHVFGGDRWI